MRHDIFATPFWHIEGASQQVLESYHQWIVDDLYRGVYKFKEKYPSESHSNQGGYQSPPFSWEDFHPEGKQYINKVIEELGIGKCEIRWWCNINPTGAWNLPHTHPGADFALVWYLTDSDGLLHLINPYMRPGVSNKVVKAKKGDIIIFPCDIMHFVLPNQRKEDRICISMNLRISGNYW